MNVPNRTLYKQCDGVPSALMGILFPYEAVGPSVMSPEQLFCFVFKLFGGTVVCTVLKARLYSLDSKYQEEKWPVVWVMF